MVGAGIPHGHLAWTATSQLQAPTRLAATAPLSAYVHVQIMTATILLSKCLIDRYFSVLIQNNKNNVFRKFKKYFTASC